MQPLAQAVIAQPVVHRHSAFAPGSDVAGRVHELKALPEQPDAWRSKGMAPKPVHGPRTRATQFAQQAWGTAGKHCGTVLHVSRARCHNTRAPVESLGSQVDDAGEVEAGAHHGQRVGVW